MRNSEQSPRITSEEESEGQRGAKEPDPRRTSILDWLRKQGLMIYAVGALSLGSTFHQERLEAAEIPPHVSFYEGIEILKKGTFEDTVETSAIFFINKTSGSGGWVVSREGEAERVELKPEDAAKGIEQELLKNPAESIIVCETHTHPIRAGLAAGLISEEEAEKVKDGLYNLSMPPSGSNVGGDINLWNYAAIEKAFEVLKQKGTPVETHRAVVDPAGVTYYRLIKGDRDLKELFPSIFAEVEQRRALFRKWNTMVKLLFERLDDETVEKLHQLTEHKGKYDDTSLPKETVAQWKRNELKEAMAHGLEGANDIAYVLFKDNEEARTIHREFEVVAQGAIKRNGEKLDRVRKEWIKTSLTTSPLELPDSDLYKRLREAYAKNATLIRFVPHGQVPDEPPCAGVDYSK